MLISTLLHIIVPSDFSVIALSFSCHIQEKNLAIAEGRPLPTLYGSEDVRPLNMEDFKFAHEQVAFNSTPHPLSLSLSFIHTHWIPAA